MSEVELPHTLEDTEFNDCDDQPLLLYVNETELGAKTASNQTEVHTTEWTPVSESSTKSQYQRLIGLGFIVFGALNISLLSTCVKFAMHYVTSHEAVFWRSLLSFGFNFMFVRWHKVDLRISSQHQKLLLVRCILGTLSICFQFYAMSKMVLTDAVVIIFTSPVITFILGAVFLREPIDRVDFAAALLSYTAVLFVTRPAFLFPSAVASSSVAPSDGIISATLAACCQACAYIVMRKLHDVHHMASIHYFSLFGIGFSLVMLIVFDVTLSIPQLRSVRLALIAASFFTCVGLLSITIGFQRERAGIASVMRYFDVIFVIIWDTIFLREHVHGFTLLGGAIILSGASVIAYRKANEPKK